MHFPGLILLLNQYIVFTQSNMFLNLKPVCLTKKKASFVFLRITYKSKSIKHILVCVIIRQYRVFPNQLLILKILN